MSLALLFRDIWLAELALLALLVLVVIGKRLWNKFPVFSAYTTFNLLEGVLAYAVQGTRAYVYVYIVNQTISVALGLGVVYEVFKCLFSAHAALRKLARLIFCGVAVALLILAGAVISARLPFDVNHAQAAVLVVEEAARILEVGLIMFLVAFSAVFGLHWRQPVFGIALGLGVFTAVKLAVVTLLPHAGTSGGFLTVAGMVSYGFSLLVWLGYLSVPERVPSAAELPKRAQLEQWNRAIMELINQ